MASGSQSISCPVRKPMAKVGLVRCAARRAASPAASACVSADRAWSRKARPAAVNSIPCTLRFISQTPPSYSRSRIWRLSEGCAVCSVFSAATVRLPASATATKKRRCRSSMASFHICEACHSAYKVFFDGARDAHLDPQEWVFVRVLEGLPRRNPVCQERENADHGNANSREPNQDAPCRNNPRPQERSCG